ncbi:tRNA(Ile)-lysidine synthase [Buchnera aphidicola (Tetraneura ulmi)]
MKKIIEKYKKNKFLIAYSGGIDSTVLLYKFIFLKRKDRKIKFRVIHINHSVQKESYNWSQFCENICKKEKINIIIKKIKNNYIKKYGLEADLRKQRYKEIKKEIKKNEILLTAHNLDDQCETFFLALKRGSGPTGLSSMPYKKNIGKNLHIRPFLNVTKKKITQWAVEKKLTWIEDPSNKNIKNDRNFIRKKIIPLFESRWNFFKNTCYRSIKICSKEKKILEDLTKKTINKKIQKNKSLNIDGFENLKKTFIYLILRNWISLHKKKNPSYKMITQIYKKVILMPQNTNPVLLFKTYKICRYKKSIYIIDKKKENKNIILFWKNTSKPLVLPNELGLLKTKKINNKETKTSINKNKKLLINIRFLIKNQTVFCIKNNKKTTIKNFWNENNIPIWNRTKIPFLYFNNKFIIAFNHFSSFKKKTTLKKYFNIYWEKNKN